MLSAAQQQGSRSKNQRAKGFFPTNTNGSLFYKAPTFYHLFIMIRVDTSKLKVPSFKHQLIGTEAVVNSPAFALFDEMGNGKTKQAIDAACYLFDTRVVDTIIVAAPAQVKGVWLNPELGEIAKFAWVPSQVWSYDGKRRKIELDHSRLTLKWIVTSYEFLRQISAIEHLIKIVKSGRQAMLIMDESIALKNHKAVQTRSIFELSKHCDRKLLLNGTPNPESLLDLYSQFACLDKKILGFKTFWQFRARYAILGGFNQKQVVSFKNKEELAMKTRPYVLRRLKSDCLDLPEKLYTHREVPLTAPNWNKYKQMRDDLVVWFSEQQAASMTQHAAVKALRLSQICAGFVGGVLDLEQEEWELFGYTDESHPIVGMSGEVRTEEIGKEKTQAALDWLAEMFDQEKNSRVLLWCRFRPELARIHRLIQEAKLVEKLFIIQGGQSKTEREAAVTEGMAGTGPCIILGNPAAGGFGLNLVTLNQVGYLSCGYSLLIRLQSEDRVHRPGQTKNVLYTDFVATGPEGQKTIDSAVVKALRKKEDAARWTTDKWREELVD